MPAQIIPIQDVASAGVIKDTPSITLPPNVYSDVSNVRFHAGAARKMEGEKDLALTGLPSNVTYVAYWKAPSKDYYIIVGETGETANIVVWDIEAGELVDDANATMTTSDSAEWQHTLFNGGFNIILNNGVDVPHYYSDPVASLIALPNWDSYLSQEDVTSVVWDEFNNEISLGRGVDFATQNLLYTVIPRDTTVGIFNYTLTGTPVPGAARFSLITTDPDNFIVTPMERTAEDLGALPGDTITISVQTRASIQVRAGVIRAYGNLLVAGNLTEMDADDNTMIVRRLPGTIRTSDVAAPGAIPLNWNPFRNGANTADEFILSSTGVVQDMAELQGVMYVYTDVSIHAIQQTGNPVIPFQVSTTTDSYGANSLGAVMEFDGRHLVVGSQDIYVFAGHPGSISSIADGRVRHHIYDLNPDMEFDANNVRMVRNQKYDEIWMFTPGLTQMYVWNYRNQSWTIRDQSPVVNGSQGIDSPLFCTGTQVFEADKGFFLVDGVTGYPSFVERLRLPLTPEFTTETIGSTALWYSSDETFGEQPNLAIMMAGTNKPGQKTTLATMTSYDFISGTDYKVDTRIQGRFMNYRLTDDTPGTFQNKAWNISGYQFEVTQGGKR